jgi:hypothetical protein
VDARIRRENRSNQGWGVNDETTPKLFVQFLLLPRCETKISGILLDCG